VIGYTDADHQRAFDALEESLSDPPCVECGNDSTGTLHGDNVCDDCAKAYYTSTADELTFAADLDREKREDFDR
jgi:hypothetical protein